MRKAGTLFIILGTVLLLAALALFLFNQQESNTAGNAAVEVMPQLVEQIQTNTAQEQERNPIQDLDLLVPVELLTEEDTQMTEVQILGNGYIGFLSIPSLGLELPILGTWSYPKLQIAPCRYTGSLRGEDLVLMAHNYNSHFGRISKLNVGDTVFFTDMDGQIVEYQVMGKDILPPDAVEEMIAGTFDLTLFTCTYGGGSRITVYCDQLTE